MAGTYTYTFLAKDLMSSKLSQIGNKGKSTFTTINQKVDNMTVNIHKADRASQKLNGTWNKAIGLATRLGLAFSFGQVVGSVINLGAEMEQTRISFETMLGSADKANKVINDLNQFSNKTPFKNKEVLTAGRNLLAFGIAQEKVLPTMRAIGDVSAGLKIPFNELSEIYGKIKVQNTVFSEDLNQLAGRGIPIFDELAKVMGVAPENIKKLASQGKITFPYIEQAFNNMSGEGGKFFNLMEKQSQSFGGKWSTFLGKLQLGATKLGEKALPTLNKLVDWGNILLDMLPKIPILFNSVFNTIKENSTVIGLLTGTIIALNASLIWSKLSFLAFTVQFKAYVLWTKIATAAQWLWNAALTANPIGLVVAAVFALGAAVVYAYQKVGWFRGGINAAWEVLKGFGTAMKELVVDRFKEMLAGLSSLGEAFLHFFKGDWQKAWDAGKKGVQGLTGYGGDAIKNFQANARVTGKKAAEAFGKGMDEAAANKKSGSIMDLIKNKVGLGSSAGTSDGATGSPAGTGPLGDSLKDGINAINGGGSRQTNITVTFDKLVENFTISSQNIQQGMAQSEEELKRMLLRVLNSTNQMQTSPT